jgi:hypothetical protein
LDNISKWYLFMNWMPFQYSIKLYKGNIAKHMIQIKII